MWRFVTSPGEIADIDDDEQGDEATSQFLGEDVDVYDGAQPLIGGVSIACGTCGDTDTHMIT